MAPGGALSAPGRCRGQKTSESAGRAPRPTQCTGMVPGRERPRKAPGWRLGGPSGTRRVPGFAEDLTARRGAPRLTHSALGKCRVARTLQKAATGVTTTNEDDDEDDDDTRPGLIGMCTYIYICIYKRTASTVYTGDYSK